MSTRTAVALGLALLAVGAGAWFLAARKPPGATTAPAAPPPPGVALFVAEPEVFVRKQPQQRAEALARLKIGQQVQVGTEPTKADGTAWRQVISGAGAGGYIADTHLGAQQPTPAAALELAQEALAGADLTLATREASRVVALDPASREGWDVLAAIHDARGDVQGARLAYQRRMALPAPPKPQDDPPRFDAPTAGQRRYVAATTLRVRSKPSRTAPVLAQLPLNHALEVAQVDGEFARVRWARSERQTWAVDLSAGGAGKRLDGEAQGQLEGYAAVAYLAPAPLDAAELQAEGDRALAEKRYRAAARAFERAAALTPSTPLLQRVARSAALAREYQLAASSAVKLAQGGGDASAAQLNDLTLYFGCEKPPPDATGDTCTADAEVVPSCEPCHPVDGAAFLGDDASDGERKQAARDFAAAEREHAAAQKAHQREVEKLSAAEARLRARFPSGPWLKATVKGDDALAAAGRRVFVLARGFTVGGYCGNYETSLDAPRLSAGDIPWPRQGETIELWATGDGYAGVVYAIVAAGSAEEVQRLFADGGPWAAASQLAYGGDPAAFVPAPNVPGPFQACANCCGC